MDVSPEYSELAAAFDGFAASEERWRRRNRTYHRLIEHVFRFHVPPDKRVLEIGCGSGGLLAALEPSHGVGIDVSEALIQQAQARYPSLRFERAAGEQLELGESITSCSRT